MCYAHTTRWTLQRRRDRFTVIESWCRTERPVSDSRCVAMAGLAPLVARQILFGIFNRSRRGAHTRLEALQRVVDFLRPFEPPDLKLLGDVDIPPKWPRPCRPLLKIIMLTARYGDSSPEHFKQADV